MARLAKTGFTMLTLIGLVAWVVSNLLQGVVSSHDFITGCFVLAAATFFSSIFSTNNFHESWQARATIFFASAGAGVWFMVLLTKSQ